MASIQKRPDGKYRARYRDSAGREHARHFALKKDAQRWLDETTASLVVGTYADPRAGRRTLADYAAQWEAAQVGRDNTRRILDNAIRVHIVPALGSRELSSLRPSDIQGFVRTLSETLAPGTVRNVYEALSRMLTAAVDDRVLGVSPCRRIKLPREEETEVVIPTLEEVSALVAAMPQQYRAAVVTLAGTGLRIGELLGAKVSDVDFLRRTLRVERQRLQDGKVGPPKSAKSVRTIPVGAVVLDTLAAHLAEYGAGEWLAVRYDGQPLTYSSWKRIWNRALEVSGLDMDTHELRHFCASALISGGASVKQVQTFLGHSSATITLRTYSHLWPGDDDRTRSVVDAAMSVLRTGCGPKEVSLQETAGQSG